MTAIDWLALAIVAFAAIAGFARGLVGSAFSAVGVVVGVVVGGRLAPLLFPGGDESAYAPLVALGGAAVGAIVLEGVASLASSAVRRALRPSPLLAIDSAGGLVLGVAAGLALAWVLGAVALHFPGQPDLRRAAQRSVILERLNRIVPPDRVIDAIERVDPIPIITGPLAPVDPPEPDVLRRPGVRRAVPSVVRVLGSACGLSVSGSGWVARPGLVVTAAHVVAGQRDTTVEDPASGEDLDAQAVAFDARNDVAVLEVPGLAARPLPLGDTSPGEAVAILGYPEDGGLAVTPGRIGRTARVLARDAYGRGPVSRLMTSFRGLVRHGNSGGPAVSSGGRVETTVVAAREGSQGGFGVPTAVVRDTLARISGPVSTGPCTR